MADEEKRIKIEDKRVIDAVTNKPVKDSSRFGREYREQFIKDIVFVSKQLKLDPYTALAVGLQESNFGEPAESKINPYAIFGYENPFFTKGEFWADDEDKEKRGAEASEAYYLFMNNFIKPRGVVAEETRKIIDLPVDNFAQQQVKESLLEKNQNISNRLQQLSEIAEPLAYLKKKIESKKDLPEEVGIQGYNGYGVLKKKYYVSGEVNSAYGLPLPIDLKKNPVYGKRVIDLRDNVLKENESIRKIVENATNKGI